MKYVTRLLPFLVAALFVATSVRAQVRDDGAFFSPAAVDQANQTIAQVNGRYNKNLVIETFPAIPDDLKDKYDPQKQEAFFKDWAQQRFDARHVNGVYVLINKDPRYLMPVVGSDTEKLAFTANDRDRLGTILKIDLKAGKNDQALQEGVDFFQRTIVANAKKIPGAAPTNGAATSTPPSYTPPSGNSAPPSNPFPGRSSGGPGIGFWIILAIGAFIVIRIIRRLFSGFGSGYQGGPGYGGPGYGNPGYGQGTSGGGFGTGLLGGLLGGMAGGWLENRGRQRWEDGGSSNAGPTQSGGGGGVFGNDPGSMGGGGGTFGNDAGSSGGGDSGGGGGGGGDAGSGGSF